MRNRFLILAALSAIAISACSKDSNTEPTGSGSTSAPVYTLVLDTGVVDSISAPVGTAVPVRVKLTKAGSAVSGSTVTWKVTSGHGTLSPSTSTTDANGIATVAWTLGDTTGLQAISAAAEDAAVAFRAVATPGAVAKLTRISADSSTVVAGASLLLTVRVTDIGGNAVPGTSVTWMSSAGTLSSTTTTTGASGNAEVALSTTARGSYTVTATVPGIGTVTFVVGAI
jgi:adhesin/invasin